MLRPSAGRIAVAAALAVSLAAPASTQAAGSVDTAALQVALRAHGVYTGTVDGFAGPTTQAAVRDLERRAGLAVDGIAGPRVRRSLGSLGRHSLGSRVLRVGRVGWDVSALQFRLAWHGFPSGLFDGAFGAHVQAAVRAFQRFAGLPADGVAGPATLASLRRHPIPVSPLRLARPVRAGVGDRFGPRGARFHAGLDFPAPAGTTVRAAGAGGVDFTGWVTGYGQLVIVRHRLGVATLYAHLSQLLVRPGEWVAGGRALGRVGATGDATGPHLHFEVRLDGAAVDPSTALG